MSPIAATLMIAGSVVALLAGFGLLRFRSPYARFHAAGKASPIAFLIAAIGAAFELGWSDIARLGVATAALVLTLPVGVHLLFRAVHRTDPTTRPEVDELPVPPRTR
ncbi:MAG: monovalent cation/H(+) antiporter subunit G [Actinomycetota bacterium]